MPGNRDSKKAFQGKLGERRKRGKPKTRLKDNKGGLKIMGIKRRRMKTTNRRE